MDNQEQLIKELIKVVMEAGYSPRLEYIIRSFFEDHLIIRKVE